MNTLRFRTIAARAITASLLFCGWYLLCSLTYAEDPEDRARAIANHTFSMPIERPEGSSIIISRLFATPYNDGTYNRTIELVSDGEYVMATESGLKVIETTPTSVTFYIAFTDGISRLMIFDGLKDIRVRVGDVLKAGTVVGVSTGIFRMYIKSYEADGSIWIADPIPYLSHMAEYTNTNIQLIYNNQDILILYQNEEYIATYEEIKAAGTETNYAVQSQNTVQNQQSQQSSGGLLDWLFSVDLGGLIGLVIGGWIVLKVLGFLFSILGGKETYYHGGQKFDNTTDWITRMEEDEYYEKHHR